MAEALCGVGVCHVARGGVVIVLVEESPHTKLYRVGLPTAKANLEDQMRRSRASSDAVRPRGEYESCSPARSAP